jgi:hypothetical protein
MNRNVVASFGLSVFVVLFFAVILYQPESSPPPLAATQPVEPVEAHPPSQPAANARATAPTVPRDVATTAGPRAPSAIASRSDVFPRPRKAAPGRNGPTVPPPPNKRPTILDETRGAFTQARAGETLGDVARRVYGSRDGIERLWLANRDLLDRPDGPLHAGTLLRTP